MNKKIPADAFSYYFSLGPGRSYEAVAEKYGATKRGVADHAKRERWSQRIDELEQRARAQAEEQALESVAEMNLRHIREARFLQSKGLEGLRSGRPELLSACGKLVASGLTLERLIRGQATERTENVESIIRREYDRWLVREGGEVGEGESVAADERGEGDTRGEPSEGDSDSDAT